MNGSEKSAVNERHVRRVVEVRPNEDTGKVEAVRAMLLDPKGTKEVDIYARITEELEYGRKPGYSLR
jgi:hypothetical protein